MTSTQTRHTAIATPSEAATASVLRGRRRTSRIETENNQALAQEEESAKGIKAEEVVNRIKPSTVSATSNSPGARNTPRPKRHITYRSNKPFIKTPPAQDMEYAQVGVTIWRLQGDSKDLRQESVARGRAVALQGCTMSKSIQRASHEADFRDVSCDFVDNYSRVSCLY